MVKQWLIVALAWISLAIGTSCSPAPHSASPDRARAGAVGDAALASEYRRLADEMEAHFHRFRARWYPRIVDRDVGGYGPQLTHDFQPAGTNTKFLVFQSRMAWVAASVAERYPEQRDEYLGYARHGSRFLNARMWDTVQGGGFYWHLDETLKPLIAEKHVYGIAFAIYGLSAVAKSSGDASERAMALRAFDWLEQHAHDARNGGYYEALSAAGAPLMLAPKGRISDEIGTQYGKKSMNTHLHVLEALTALDAVVDDARVRQRLEEVMLVLRDKVTAPEGWFRLYFEPNWRPLATNDSYGHDVEGAFLITEAAEAIGKAEDPTTRAVARRLVDHALEFGWDATHGGFFDSGPPGGAAEVRDKVWWAQAESLNGLLLMHRLYGSETRRYFDAFVKQWQFIKDHVIDPKTDGWFGTVHEDGKLKDPGENGIWKCAYHDGRALMQSIAELRELARAGG